MILRKKLVQYSYTNTFCIFSFSSNLLLLMTELSTQNKSNTFFSNHYCFNLQLKLEIHSKFHAKLIVSKFTLFFLNYSHVNTKLHKYNSTNFATTHKHKVFCIHPTLLSLRSCCTQIYSIEIAM